MGQYWQYRTAAFLSRLFPEKLSYWAGLRIADAFYRLNHTGRRAVMSNLARIYKSRGIVPAEEALEGLARKTFQYFGKYLIDFFRYSSLTREDIRRKISIEHGEYIEQCIGAGKGAILLSAHFGNWELGGAALAAMGNKVSALVLQERTEKLERLFERQRRSRGVELIAVGKSAFGLVRKLRNNEIVAMLGDRDFTGKDDRIPFFGEPARIPRGPAWLSVKTGTPILVGFMLRQVDDTFLMRILPPIYPEQLGSVEAVRAKIRDLLEAVIGEYPYQWFIFNDFWAGGDGDAEEAARDI